MVSLSVERAQKRNVSRGTPEISRLEIQGHTSGRCRDTQHKETTEKAEKSTETNTFNVSKAEFCINYTTVGLPAEELLLES